MSKIFRRSRFFRTMSMMLLSLLLVIPYLGVGTGTVKAAGEWVARDSKVPTDLYNVEYGNGLWVAVGNNGQVSTSLNGTDWNLISKNLFTGGIYDVSYILNKWITVGDSGDIFTSKNGVDWSPQTSGVIQPLYGLASDGKVIVAVGEQGTVLTSTDGVSWAPRNLGAGNFVSVYEVVYGGDQFVIVGAGGAIYTSPDGITWTPKSSKTTADLYNVTYANGQYVVVGSGILLTSSDGNAWVSRSLPSEATGKGLNGIAYGHGKYVAVGDDGLILSSKDAINWIKEESNISSYYFNRVAYGDGKFVAVGQQGSNGHALLVTQDPVSTDANLSGLSLSRGTLNPVFSADQTSYTASVGNAVASVDVTATVADATATLEVNGKPATSGTAATVSLSVGPNSIPVKVTAEDGTTIKTYTITVTREKSSNADLSNLTLSAGTLSPAFSSGMTAYTASVANAVGSLDITPTVADSTATVTVNGTAATSGVASKVTLNVGPNTITVLVTAQNGTTKTYTVTVTRQLSSNADLSNLTLSQGTLNPGFSSGTTSYSAKVGYQVKNVDVMPTVADANATVKVNGTRVTSGTAQNVPLDVGPNMIDVVVTAEDGTTNKYTITVTRQEASTNADLINLTLSAGILDPMFIPGNTNYAANVANGVAQVDVTATVADPNATVKVNGTSVTSGNATPVSLHVGPNPIEVEVTAEDGTTSKTYTITVTREKSNNADLINLTLSAGTLDPVFSSGTTYYTAIVGNGVTQVDVTPTVADANATVKVDGDTVTSGTAKTVSLKVGPNPISVEVTAEDGTTTNTYTITVTREKSSIADLSNLTISQGILDPVFNSGTTKYTAEVDYKVKRVDVTPTVADANATVKVDGTSVTSGIAHPVSLNNVGPNTIDVVVTAEDGTTTKAYTITVTRQAPSSNADLSNLTLSAGTLDPAFSSGHTDYAVNVANGVGSIDITPTVADSGATISMGGELVTSGQGKTVTLIVGTNLIPVVVTAEDGVFTKTYTITVTREPSDIADLNGLTLSEGTLTPSFDAHTTSYTADVASEVASVDVTPSVADATATIKVNGDPVTSGKAKSISLNVGPNPIAVVVTAQDGVTTQTYNIIVTRADVLSSVADLQDLVLSDGTLAPAFDANTTAYTATVTNSVYGVDITPTVADITSTVKVNQVDVASGSAVNVPLNVGPNPIEVVVTAQDGTSKTYTITITRAEPLSGNANLSGLTVSKGTLTPAFDPGIMKYTVNVAHSVYSVDITPMVPDITSTIKVNGVDVQSGKAVSVPLVVGQNNIEIMVTAQDGTEKAYSILITRDIDRGGGNNGGEHGGGSEGPGPVSDRGTTPAPSTPPTPDNGFSMKQTTVDGRKVTTVTFSSAMLAKIKAAAEGMIVTIPVNTLADDAIVEIDPELMKELQQKKIKLEVTTEYGQYTLPLQEVSTSGGDFKVHIKLSNVRLQDQASGTGSDLRSQIIAPVVDFSVSVDYGDHSTSISTFKNYVKRMIPIAEGTDKNEIVTGVQLLEDGTMLPVPTKIVEKDGRLYAELQSMNNGTFTVIQHRQTFADTHLHWAQKSIENMASRLIVNGTDQGHFQPDHAITRAEFISIMVRALGLRGADNQVGFSDVNASDWYSDSVNTGVSYGLIQGYGNGEFRPGNNITRQEAMTMIFKAMKLAGMDTSLTPEQIDQALSTIADQQSISGWAREAAALNAREGITAGYQGKLTPLQDITRAETVMMIERLLQKADLI